MANDKIDMKDYSVTSTADIPSRSVISVISTNTIDEEGEVILPRGVQVQRFQKSPVVFYNHDYSDPVATCEYIKITDDNLIASTYFPERPDNHVGEWRPDTVLSMVASGLCQGVSIGFSYIETREPTSKDRKQFPTTGNELQRVVSKSRLLEYSFAPLPMNEDALVVAVQRGFVNQDGSLNERAIKSCRLELDGGAQRSVRLIPSQSLKLKAIDTDKMTKIEIQRLQGRVY
jgi:phage head maturation protease|tara:strand:+ start:4420 stop:5112 length:693 start_codon:yes stop_codon:yes gene_type:complete